LGSGNCQSLSVGRGRAATVATSNSPKLGLPQHRYCKVESDQVKLDGPTGTFSYFCWQKLFCFCNRNEHTL